MEERLLHREFRKNNCDNCYNLLIYRKMQMVMLGGACNKTCVKYKT
jgi:RNase P subunit RPR2